MESKQFRPLLQFESILLLLETEFYLLGVAYTSALLAATVKRREAEAWLDQLPFNALQSDDSRTAGC